MGAQGRPTADGMRTWCWLAWGPAAGNTESLLKELTARFLLLEVTLKLMSACVAIVYSSHSCPPVSAFSHSLNRLV